MLLAIGIQNANIKVKFSSFLVIIFYLLAFGMKTIYLLAKKEALEEREEENTETEDKPKRVKRRKKRGE